MGGGFTSPVDYFADETPHVQTGLQIQTAQSQPGLSLFD